MSARPLIPTISENYKILKVLGEGSFGQVLKCVKQDTKETVAVKMLKKASSDIREVTMLEKLKSLDPDKVNIVRCHETFQHISRTFMVFEMLDMSLLDYIIQTGKKPLPLNGIRTIIKDVSTALSALKKVGLVHTDLKLDNIMLVDHQRQPFRAKLIDFGLTIEKWEAMRGLRVQALWYRSPEVLLCNRFTAAIDIWALGIMMAEMLLGFTPFPGKNPYDMLRYIMDLLGEPPKRLLNKGMATKKYLNYSYKYRFFIQWKFKKPEEFFKQTGIKPLERRIYKFSSLDEFKYFPLNEDDSAERSHCVELLKKMLQMDPRKRITPQKILAHPFITSFPNPVPTNTETVPTETSTQTAKSTDTAETDERCVPELPQDDFVVQQAPQVEEAAKQSPDIRCAPELPLDVIVVQQAPQVEEEAKQSPDISQQDGQNNTTASPTAPDDKDTTPVADNGKDGGDSGIHTVSLRSSAKARPAAGSKNHLVTEAIPNQISEKSDAIKKTEVTDSKKKGKKGIRGFFSNLRRRIRSCFCLPKTHSECSNL